MTPQRARTILRGLGEIQPEDREAIADMIDGMIRPELLINGDFRSNADWTEASAQDDLRATLADAGRVDPEVERLRVENDRLWYVLDGVGAAIDTGRNEPLVIWREQIEIARSALKGKTND